MADAAPAPPPTMAAFAAPAGAQPGAPGFDALGGGGGGAPGFGPAGANSPGGFGVPAAGGNQFVRQTKTGARSRYVDTLNPGAAGGGPVPGTASPLTRPGGALGGPAGAGSGSPRPKFTVFVPKAADQQSAAGGAPDAPS